MSRTQTSRSLKSWFKPRIWKEVKRGFGWQVTVLSRNAVPAGYTRCLCVCLHKLLGKVMEKTWLGFAHEPDPSSGRLLTPSLALGMRVRLPSLLPEFGPRTQLWDDDVVLRPSGQDTWWNPVQASPYTFKILTGQCRDQLTIWLPKTSLVCKFHCFLTLSPTDVEWSAPFFGPSVPSAHGGQFQSTARKLLKSLWTNMCPKSKLALTSPPHPHIRSISKSLTHASKVKAESVHFPALLLPKLFCGTSTWTF